VWLVTERPNLSYFLGVDALNFEGDELVGVWLFITHGSEALHIGWIDVEDAKGYEVVDVDAANVRLLQGTGVIGGYVDERIGLELLGVEAGESEFGHAIDEGGIGGEDGVAAKFVIVDGARAGERAGFCGEGRGEVGTIIREVGDGHAGEAAHGFIAEIHAAVVITYAVGIPDAERELAAGIADSDGAPGVDGGERFRLRCEKCSCKRDGESEVVEQFHF